MPRETRSAQEIELVKEKILDIALHLFIEHGYKGFSMRKLASRLRVSATNIYYYYKNKDEIYLMILTRGYAMLNQYFLDYCSKWQNPADRVRAIIDAYMDFGLTNPILYDLMNTRYVPRYNDYLGTEMEPVAAVELETALQSFRIVIGIMKEYIGITDSLHDAEIRDYTIIIWVLLYGYITAVNNQFVVYIHKNPMELKDLICHTAEKIIFEKIDELKKSLNR